MARKKRYRNPNWVGRNWAVSVHDGNADEWLICCPDGALGPVMRWQGMTHDQARDVARAIRKTADLLEQHFPPNGGSAKVIAFKAKV